MIDPSRVPAITPQEADRRLREQPPEGGSAPLLVDVREPGEFFSFRAPGAVLMPLSQFMASHTDLPRDRPLFMICASGSRSARATAFLLANGWPDVTNVAGGTIGWMGAGLETRRGALAPREGELPG